MTISQALTWAIKKLQLKNIDSASLDAEILLAFVLKQDKTYLYTHPEQTIDFFQLLKYQYYIYKRYNYYPIAYLTKHKEFYGNDFYINKYVLVPRPVSEYIIEQALKLIDQNNIKTIAEIGTGSGCLSITLKKLRPEINMIATDISQKALQVAQINAKKHKVDIHFIYGNLLEPIIDKKIDLLIANLPYLDNQLYSNNLYLRHEPKSALVAKNHGLAYYIRTLDSLSRLPIFPRHILFEINPNQLDLIKPHFNKYDISLNNRQILTANFKMGG